MTSLAGSERGALCDALEESGADAPTLCEAWTTYDLAAHLVVRERRPLAAPGIAVSFLSSVTEREMRRLQDRFGYPGLVALIRSGPPRWSPTRAPRIAEAANGLEFFVHHEDVRRAVPDWAPRELSFAAQTLLWSRLGRMGRALARRSPVGLELVRTDTPDAVRAKQGEPTVVVRGLPNELVLWCFGRRSVAQVELDGDPAAIQALAGANLSL